MDIKKAKALYRELTGNLHYGDKKPCPQCLKLGYSYDDKNLKAVCKCGFEVHDKDVIMFYRDNNELNPKSESNIRFWIDSKIS